MLSLMLHKVDICPLLRESYSVCIPSQESGSCILCTYLYALGHGPSFALHCNLLSKELIPSSRCLTRADEDPICSRGPDALLGNSLDVLIPSSRCLLSLEVLILPRDAGTFKELFFSSKVSDFTIFPFVLKVPLTIFLRWA